MAQNKIAYLPSIALTTTIANIYSPPTITGGTNPPLTTLNSNTYYIIRHIRVINTTATAINFALWKQVTIGASPVAGKEYLWAGTATLLALDANRGQTVSANNFVETFPLTRLMAGETDLFIVGGASATGLTITAEVEWGIL